MARQGARLKWHTDGLARHLRWLAEDDVHRQIDDGLLCVAVPDPQMRVLRGLSQHRDRTAFTCADCQQRRHLCRRDTEHIALLGFVTPDLERREAGIGTRNRAQFEPTAALTVMQQLRHCIGQTTGAHIVNRKDRIFRTECTACINHFLRAAFHFGVVALH